VERSAALQAIQVGRGVPFGASSQLALCPGSKLVSPLIVVSSPLPLDQAVSV
jgi:hypothetical protein